MRVAITLVHGPASTFVGNERDLLSTAGHNSSLCWCVVHVAEDSRRVRSCLQSHTPYRRECVTKQLIRPSRWRVAEQVSAHSE